MSTVERQPNPLDAAIAEAVGGITDITGVRLAKEMLDSAFGLVEDAPATLDLKIAAAALAEMREAFAMFAPYRDISKVTVFGSARTLTNDPLYAQATEIARLLAHRGWMVVTGAGPGIMQAAMEGAGREQSIGVSIRLPFEQGANPVIAGDEKSVSMKYFFTRKLMLVKESRAFVCLPGGFGTLDETFELLTLLQTGKAAPAPIVLLDVPGGTYWPAWERFVREEVVEPGRARADDMLLYHIADDVDAAAGEILGFYRNYHSIRYVGRKLVVRLRAAPRPEELDALSDQFADICRRGRIEVTAPLSPEVSDGDHLALPRIAFDCDRSRQGRLRVLIDAVNRLPSAPPVSLPSPDSAAAAGAPPEATDDEETTS